MRIRGENPVYKRVQYDLDQTDAASYKGVAIKTALMLLITAFIALYIAKETAETFNGIQLLSALIGAPILAYIMVILAHRNQQLAWMYSILYALFEGMFLGVITLYVYSRVGFDGISYALLGTFGTILVMLFIHSTGLIKITRSFKSFLFTALFSLVFVSVLYFILTITGVLSGAMGVGIYLALVAVSVMLSAFFLLYDFDQISRHINGGAAKSSEWSLSLGLMVTIVWLYIDMLRIVYYVLGRD